MSETDEDRELKVRLMKADIANKEADTSYKLGLARYEPWKLVFGGAAAGAALTVAGAGLTAGFLALYTWLHPVAPQSPTFPAGTVITIPAAPQK